MKNNPITGPATVFVGGKSYNVGNVEITIPKNQIISADETSLIINEVASIQAEFAMKADEVMTQHLMDSVIGIPMAKEWIESVQQYDRLTALGYKLDLITGRYFKP